MKSWVFDSRLYFRRSRQRPDLGAAGIAAYAQREGDEIEAFISRFEPLLTPEFVGQVVVDLCIGDDRVEPDGLAFMLSGAGLRVLK